VDLTGFLRLVPKLGMSAAITVLPHMPLWHSQIMSALYIFIFLITFRYYDSRFLSSGLRHQAVSDLADRVSLEPAAVIYSVCYRL
jgi:hypothetical protein